MHKLVVNPRILPNYKTNLDRQNNLVSTQFDTWIVEDQSLFICLLSSFFDSTVPRVLTCNHSYKIWHPIYKYLYVVLKARVCQIWSKLKSTKKENCIVSRYVLCAKVLVDSVLIVKDTIAEQDQVEIFLEGLP